MKILFLLIAMLGAALPSHAQIDQACIDGAVIDCFDGCNNPSNFQECIIGCATGANNDAQNCRDQCFNDPTCISKCLQSIRAISTCPFVSGHLTARSGTIVLNRATGFWQLSVRITNTSTTNKFDNVGLVLDSLNSGWTLLNGDGVTSDLAPAGSPFKNLGTLQPGTSQIVVLQFKRVGTLPFGYITRIVSSVSR